jgi:ATP-binding cassette subfamily C (CFTR/MRP) protein 10
MLDLEELREQLVIIPQEPFLFSGTIRENLDPFRFCSERQILDVVKKSKLDKLISRLGGLNAKISDQGDSLSAGQKQLLCLAR